MDPRNQPAQDDEDLLRDIRKILDDRHDADDPYERGFADKLYEDCEDPTLQTQQPPRRQQNSVSGPVIHAYNSDFRRGAAPQRREEPTTYLGPVEEDDYEPPRRQSQRSRREPERAPRREEQPRRHRAVPESGYDAEPPKKKKKHRFARGLGKLLLICCLRSLSARCCCWPSSRRPRRLSAHAATDARRSCLPERTNPATGRIPSCC